MLSISCASSWFLFTRTQLSRPTKNIQGGAKERMFLKWVVVGRVSFFGVTSNQKSTFENPFPFAKKLQLCHKKC